MANTSAIKLAGSWVNPIKDLPASTTYTVVCWSKFNLATWKGCLFGFGSSSTDLVDLYFWGDTNPNSFGYNNWNSDCYDVPNMKTKLQDNNYHHIVAEFNPIYTNHKLWIDKQQQVLSKTMANDTNNRSISNKFHLGYNGFSTTEQYYNGIFDEVYLFNRSLNQEEINALYSGICINTSGLLLYWSFNENSGTQVIDKTGNGYNGVITNGNWITDVPYLYITKYLVEDNSQIKTYKNNTWQVVGTSPVTINMFNDGMYDTSIITRHLNELTSQNLKFLTWTDNLIATPQSKLTAVPYERIIFPKGDISLISIENIDQIRVISTLTGDVKMSIIVSVDGGHIWKTWNEQLGNWDTINHTDKNEVETFGMSINSINNRIKIDWDSLINGSNKIRFAYYMKISSLTDICSIDRIEMTADMKGTWDGTSYGNEYTFSYVNNTTLVVKFLNSGDYKINY